MIFKPFSKMLNSKKAFIGGDFLKAGLDAFRSLLSWFFQTMPKPLLFIVFLMFVVLLSNFIVPIMANSFGYHCDGSGTVWKVNGLDFLVNFDLMRSKPEISGVYVTIPFICDGGSGKRGKVMGLCTDCPREENETLNTYSNCIGDGNRLDDYPYWTQKLECEMMKCAPPIGHIYNYTADKFQCVETHCINQTLLEYNNKIYSTRMSMPAYGGDFDNYTADNVVYFKCQEENPTNIRLTFFGLDIFDYRIWLIGMLLGLIIFAYTRLK